LRFTTSLTVPTGSSNPWGILLAPNKRIWFTERTGNKLAVVLRSKIKEFAIPQAGSYPEKIAAGSDGNLWFTEMQSAGVGHFNPATGKFGPVITLPSGDIPIGIASGPDKNVWFCIATYSSTSQIGEVVLH
jgi:virginiamycin B lyase